MKTLLSNIQVDQALEMVVHSASNLIVDMDKKHVRFITRLACTASFATPIQSWKGPISLSLLAFNSMVMEVSSNIRNLIEMMTLAMCVHGEVDRFGRGSTEWTKLGLM
jgi:Temperature dependent protein affecting M2 dsRNA replication